MNTNFAAKLKASVLLHATSQVISTTSLQLRHEGRAFRAERALYTSDLAHGFGQVRHLADKFRFRDYEPSGGFSENGHPIMMLTHSSNLDSIVMGWSFTRSVTALCLRGGQEPVHDPLIGYFMKNLGAYRVDRRLGHVLYKDVLKCYCKF